MDKNAFFLERMASVSPGVRLSLEGRLSLINIDSDDITHQMLVNHCFSTMIDEALELGIEFYCTLGDLCESLYTIDKVLLFFEVVFPTPLYRSITESDAFKMMISTVVIDGVDHEGETSVETILEYLALYDEKTASVFIDTYSFLQDKMKSTPVFDTYVTSIINCDNTPFAEIVVAETVSEYLKYVSTTFSDLLKAADALFAINSTSENLSTLYEDIDTWNKRAIDTETLTPFSWSYENKSIPDQSAMVQILIEKYKSQFCASVPLYEEFFILRKEPLLITHVAGLVIGAYIDTKSKEAFLSRVSEIFEKLQINGNFITNEMVSLTQAVCLALAQEYYP